MSVLIDVVLPYGMQETTTIPFVMQHAMRHVTCFHPCAFTQQDSIHHSPYMLRKNSHPTLMFLPSSSSSFPHHETDTSFDTPRSSEPTHLLGLSRREMSERRMHADTFVHICQIRIDMKTSPLTFPRSICHNNAKNNDNTAALSTTITSTTSTSMRNTTTSPTTPIILATFISSTCINTLPKHEDSPSSSSLPPSLHERSCPCKSSSLSYSRQRALTLDARRPDHPPHHKESFPPHSSFIMHPSNTCIQSLSLSPSRLFVWMDLFLHFFFLKEYSLSWPYRHHHHVKSTATTTTPPRDTCHMRHLKEGNSCPHTTLNDWNTSRDDDNQEDINPLQHVSPTSTSHVIPPRVINHCDESNNNKDLKRSPPQRPSCQCHSIREYSLLRHFDQHRPMALRKKNFPLSPEESSLRFSSSPMTTTSNNNNNHIDASTPHNEYTKKDELSFLKNSKKNYHDYSYNNKYNNNNNSRSCMWSFNEELSSLLLEHLVRTNTCIIIIINNNTDDDYGSTCILHHHDTWHNVLNTSFFQQPKQQQKVELFETCLEDVNGDDGIDRTRKGRRSILSRTTTCLNHHRHLHVLYNHDSNTNKSTDDGWNDFSSLLSIMIQSMVASFMVQLFQNSKSSKLPSMMMHMHEWKFSNHSNGNTNKSGGTSGSGSGSSNTHANNNNNNNHNSSNSSSGRTSRQSNHSSSGSGNIHSSSSSLGSNSSEKFQSLPLVTQEDNDDLSSDHLFALIDIIDGTQKEKNGIKYWVQRNVITIQVISSFVFDTCIVNCNKEGSSEAKHMETLSFVDSFTKMSESKIAELNLSTTFRSQEHEFYEAQFRKKLPYTSGRPETQKLIWLSAEFSINNRIIKTVTSPKFYVCSRPQDLRGVTRVGSSSEDALQTSPQSQHASKLAAQKGVIRGMVSVIPRKQIMVEPSSQSTTYSNPQPSLLPPTGMTSSSTSSSRPVNIPPKNSLETKQQYQVQFPSAHPPPVSASQLLHTIPSPPSTSSNNVSNIYQHTFQQPPQPPFSPHYTPSNIISNHSKLDTKLFSIHPNRGLLTGMHDVTIFGTFDGLFQNPQGVRVLFGLQDSPLIKQVLPDRIICVAPERIVPGQVRIEVVVPQLSYEGDVFYTYARESELNSVPMLPNSFSNNIPASHITNPSSTMGGNSGKLYHSTLKQYQYHPYKQ
nr:unnamed protein product [Naegleria fowleri]